eukprot:COSAG04_NODE_203_length_20431_cov_12.598269_25_plen_145_part_00
MQIAHEKGEEDRAEAPKRNVGQKDPQAHRQQQPVPCDELRRLYVVAERVQMPPLLRPLLVSRQRFRQNNFRFAERSSGTTDDLSCPSCTTDDLSSSAPLSSAPPELPAPPLPAPARRPERASQQLVRDLSGSLPGRHRSINMQA